ncbi:TRAP transporter large permease [Salipiger bermudensis]|uniref:TRAP transporter large permease protein n=1 Tax=Salipiger bermudensis (strain DSM 26914 / JCM 13377 / KCTC 12554 / HTCC2601) TaxID=314265 RepID=Q0FH53_SALBH|nr:TRAP transporter large permease [Salipiger bermudensis]EAU43520.1 probable transporter [Salipiger bermudensis HTCC2601]MCA1286999.1 TRAP transporter large permease [Salipiger bermudensis]
MGALMVAVAFFGLLAFGLPVGFAIGVAGVVGIIDMGPRFMQMVPDRMFAGLDLFPFLAMPFFILAGEIMNRSGITMGLVRLADALVGWMRGGMAHSNMVASVMFAGLTGSATADSAAFGNTLVPAMVKGGYSRPYACAVTAAGSIIGPTIPPSTLAIIYGSIMGVSIAGLFAAGILPGLLICAICMTVIALTARRKGLPKGEGRPSLRLVGAALKEGFLAALLPVFILGAILGGFATPTEAAAIAVAYALVVGGLVYRALSWRDLYEVAVRTTRITGVIFLIIASASILGWWMTFNRIPQAIAEGMLSISDNPMVIIGLILLLLLVIGLVMDINATLIILAPVLAPLTVQIGMEPVHAGIMIILALNISLMTPPVGACLFVLASVTGEKVEAITRELWPFILAEVTILLVVAYWSDLTLFIPRLLGL